MKHISKPTLFLLSKAADLKAYKTLIRSQKNIQIIDDYDEQLLELFAINNPTRVYTPEFDSEFKAYRHGLAKERALSLHGVWVHYPWLNSMVHVLDEADFWKVRTARNRYLINDDEQAKFYNCVIGIGGLSIGNSVALAIAMQGGGKHFRLADFDNLALSNTNRVRAGVQNLGLPKVIVTARQIYEINPFARVNLMSKGLNPENIESFVLGAPKLDIIIDELDNISIKYLLREQARKHGLPVVMAADNGDNAVVDVERYDLDRTLPFFHGRLGDVTYEQLTKLDKFGIGKTITQHIGPENVTERMQQSLLEMGKTIVSWPQLGGAALLNGSAVAYCVRKILCGQEIEPNRALLSFDEKLIPSYNSPAEVSKRQKITSDFKKLFGL